MDTRIRKVLQVAVAAIALGASGFASADGVIGRVADKSRGQPQSQRAERPRQESRPAARSEPRAVPRAESRPAPRVDSRDRPDAPRAEPARAQVRPAPTTEVPRASASSNDARASRGVAGRVAEQVERSAGRTADAPQPNRSQGRAAPQGSSRPAPTSAPPSTQAGSAARAPGDRGVIGRVVDHEYQDRNPRPERNHRDDRNGWRWGNVAPERHRHDHHHHVHVIHHLPSGYRDYWWNGTRYYYYDGFWYQPWGASYISVRVPYGFFVTSLPGAYTSIWIDGTRYYYSDYHYYVYEPARRGYVVVPSPYGEEDDERLGQDLYIYPAEGQSEAQQAQDRYECHRWAVDQTGYDPLDDEYDADLREDYLRAMTACLTGRGYTVR